ncbi:fused DSP-PTPase phosphatase/NAD kinase-like protein [Zavarzinella formosa]|uniref:fused DSP-PTPase phosphatase/NAD kinase-like protein n=1 Tax=Zavarzinella formosa TaxID=360055 RepID=UPI0002DE5840|nr:dual specificity protein phosphatase family protein [Zavarzinella formosa]
MKTALKWIGGAVLALGIVGIPILRYRTIYVTEKRFREVTPGKFYRCGQMSEGGFRKHLRENGIKLVINLQDEFPDPDLPSGYWDKPYITESQVCQEEGVKYVFLTFAGDRGLLPRNTATPENRPAVIDDFLKLCDDPSNYPILIHCMAGLHRTGALTSIYRMEYEDWPLSEAVRELRANGYGDRKCTMANDYIYEYLYLYKPRRPKAVDQPAPREFHP